jgi:hypothetical protein
MLPHHTPDRPEKQAAAEYPEDRPAYFANRFVRSLINTEAIKEIGHVGFALCVVIAHLEDSASNRYTRPVTFYNDHLMAVLGIRKWESLDLARKRAVAAGWLAYVPGNRGVIAARYWVLIPNIFQDLPDENFDDGDPMAPPEKFIPETDKSFGGMYPPKGDTGGYTEGDTGGEHSTLFPNPIPRRGRKRPAGSTFVAPTAEEAAAYFTLKSLDGNPAEFHDHYEGNGWKQANGLPIKDWQAAARNWSRREPQFSGRAGSNSDDGLPLPKSTTPKYV